MREDDAGESEVAGQRVGRLSADQQHDQGNAQGQRRPPAARDIAERHADERAGQHPRDEHPQQRLTVAGGQLQQRQRVGQPRAGVEPVQSPQDVQPAGAGQQAGERDQQRRCRATGPRQRSAHPGRGNNSGSVHVITARSPSFTPPRLRLPPMSFINEPSATVGLTSPQLRWMVTPGGAFSLAPPPRRGGHYPMRRTRRGGRLWPDGSASSPRAPASRCRKCRRRPRARASGRCRRPPGSRRSGPPRPISASPTVRHCTSS